MRTGAGPLIDIRPLVPADRDSIQALLVETEVFTREEVATALELVDIALHNRQQRDYRIFSGLGDDGQVAAYYCIGPTPLASGTYDLYWIAVKPSRQARGVGRQLLKHAEKLVASEQGRLILAETSSRPAYDRTREFYVKNEFQEVARIREFYNPTDDLVIFGKYLPQSGGS